MSESEKKVKVYLEQFLIDANTKTLDNFYTGATSVCQISVLGELMLDLVTLIQFFPQRACLH